MYLITGVYLRARSNEMILRSVHLDRVYASIEEKNYRYSRIIYLGLATITHLAIG